MLTAAEDLTIHDTCCDACGARFQVRVELDNGDILLCVHHAREFGFVDPVTAY